MGNEEFVGISSKDDIFLSEPSDFEKTTIKNASKKMKNRKRPRYQRNVENGWHGP